MAIEFIKADLTEHLGSPRNSSQNKISLYAACMEKYEFKSTILFTHQQRKINFLLKKTSATKHSPQSNVYNIDFFLLNIV